MILYADTSALVKKYVQEAGSDELREYLVRVEVVATAGLTQVEMAAALAKAARQGWADGESLRQAWQDFLNHWPAYLRLPLSAQVIERAAHLAWKHGLRAYDSVHLACALICQEVTDAEMIFACFDQRLRQAAAAEGLRVWPEQG